MEEVQAIRPADLRAIESNLKTIFQNIDVLNGNINGVDNKVQVVYREISSLAQEFHDYVAVAEKHHNLSVAETRLIKIRQELETKYGHYAEVRRTTTGILQADDLGIVRKDTISTATEELMISTPNYWLAPCLVALSAWICDQKDLADKAMREAIHRNDEKTSLLFALICRRAGRKQACLKWVERYLRNQDAEKLDRKCVIVLDAFASGLFGADSEGLITKQMADWLELLSEKPGFVESQTKQWSEAINQRRKVLGAGNYPYLRKYSSTWPLLQDIMEGARLHAEILTYLENIFNKEAGTVGLQEQLDNILTSLVTEFDDEEIPLRREEKLNQFIVSFQGDTDRAQASMKVEASAYETHKDFTQLLTDAAMKPESSYASVATQKFAIALSRDWVVDAYNDVVARNRMKIPNEISIDIDTFHEKTRDGKNEKQMEEKMNRLIDGERDSALRPCVLTAFEKFCLVGGIILGVIGFLMTIFDNFFGVVVIVGGVGMIINHYSKKKALDQRRSEIERAFEEKRKNGLQILLAVLAEVVDFRAEFQEKDQESDKVLEFLEGITPEQYIRKLSDSTRRIRIAE